MIRPTRMRVGFAAAALVAVVGCMAVVPSTHADRLHLESGGSVETSDWWVENDWIYYRDSSGTMGMPRSAVIRIEPIAENRPAAEDADRLPQAGIEGQALPDPRKLKRIRAALRLGRQELEAGRYEDASAEFARVIEWDSTNLNGILGFALAESTLGRDGVAGAAVLDGLVLYPESADLQEMLGNLRHREERLRDALQAWTTAFALAPNDRLRDKIEKIQREIQVAAAYDFTRSSHFNVRYDGTVDAALASDVVDFLEDRHYELSNRFRHTPNQPITLLLYPDRKFRDVTRSPEWIGGLFDGKIRVPLGGLNKLHGSARRVLTHELTHAILHSKSRGHCPWWLHEGLAQRMEGRKVEPSRYAELLAVDSSPNLRSQKDASLSYLAALSFTEYLEGRSGFASLVWLLDELGDGKDLEPALTQIFGDGWSGLQRGWRETLATRGGKP